MLGILNNFDLRPVIYTSMVLKCMKFTRRTSLICNYNGTEMIKLYSTYFAFTWYCTSFMYNLAYPIFFTFLYL